MDSPGPASIFDYPNLQENNNNNEFPDLNNNNFNERPLEINIVANEPQDDLKNESSEDDDDWSIHEIDERLREIECRRCGRTYTSGMLFVRTTCDHLTCLTCMWEFAINYGKNNCPICGTIIDYTDSIHVDDIESEPLRFRENNNN